MTDISIRYALRYICQRRPADGYTPVASGSNDLQDAEEADYERSGRQVQYLRSKDCWAACLAMIFGHRSGSPFVDSGSINQIKAIYESRRLPADPPAGDDGLHVEAIPAVARVFELEQVDVRARPAESSDAEETPEEVAWKGELLEKFHAALLRGRPALVLMDRTWQLEDAVGHVSSVDYLHAVVLSGLTARRTGTHGTTFTDDDLARARIFLADPWPTPDGLGRGFSETSCRLVGSDADFRNNSVEIRGHVGDNRFEAAFDQLARPHVAVQHILQALAPPTAVYAAAASTTTHRQRR